MGYKILIVDDEPDIRMTINTFLSGQGYNVEEASNGQEALEKLKKSEYDIMILDLLMPYMSGYELLESLPEKLLKTLPIIVLTAKTEDKDVLKGYAMGATYYVTKPFKNKTLMNIVGYLLGNLPPEELRKVERSL